MVATVVLAGVVPAVTIIVIIDVIKTVVLAHVGPAVHIHVEVVLERVLTVVLVPPMQD